MQRRTLLAALATPATLAGCLATPDESSSSTSPTDTSVTSTSTPTTTATDTPTSSPTTEYDRWPDAVPLEKEVLIDDLLEGGLVAWSYTPRVRAVQDNELIEVEATRDVFFQPTVRVGNLSEEPVSTPSRGDITVNNGWHEYEHITDLEDGVPLKKLRDSGDAEIVPPYFTPKTIAAGGETWLNPIYDIILPDPPKEEIVCEVDVGDGTTRFSLVKEN